MKPTNFRPDTDDVETIREIFEEKAYDPKWFEIENSSVKTIIDVGALIGSYTLWAYDNYPNATILTFEPNPESYDILIKNISTLKVTDRISTFNTAVWDKNCKMKLQLSSKKNTGGASIVFNPHWFPKEKSLSSIEVDVISIKEILKKIEGNIDILKLDCEGAEYDILYSLDSKDLKSIKHIVMEYHNPDLEPNKVKKLIQFLRNNGFLVQKSPGNKKLGYIYAKQIYQNLDFVNQLIDEQAKLYEKQYTDLANRKVVKMGLKLVNLLGSTK